MRRASRGLIVIGSLLACLVTGVAATAQDKPADNMDVLREKMRADKKVLVASVLELTESEAKVFWPVYNAYQSDMITHYDRLLKLIDTFGKNYETMSDEMSMKLLTDYLALERDYVAILNAYLPRFKKVLPPRKVARVYQIENKARALVNSDLARGIPYVK